MMGPTVPPRTGKLPDDWTPQSSKLDETIDSLIAYVINEQRPIQTARHIAKSQILALVEEVIGKDDYQPTGDQTFVEARNLLRKVQRLRKDAL